MIEVRHVSASYGEGSSHVLDDVDFRVGPGELVALVGGNGSGKSTLGSLLCAAMLPCKGSVTVDGVDPSECEASRREVRALCGMVRQDPRDQIVSSRVADEVAFGPRNLGLDEREVSRRVTLSLERTGLAGFGDRDSNELSGGEQQRVALAGVLAMHPRFLVADEATSQLDAVARPALRRLFAELAHAEGLGVVQITHDPVELFTSDRVVILHKGLVAWEGAPIDLLTDVGRFGDLLPLEDPYIAALRAMFNVGMLKHGDTLTPEVVLKRMGSSSGARARDLLSGSLRLAPMGTRPQNSPADRDRVLSLRGIRDSYGDVPVLDGVDLDARAGRVLLLAGRSGSGKSTLARIACGLRVPDAGTVRLAEAPVGPADVPCVFQNPESQFFCDSVYDEIAFAARNKGMGADEVARLVERSSALLGLSRELLERYPFSLSGGQARRVALAAALSLPSGACILDEPGAGLDAGGRRSVRSLARRLADDGRAVVVISHDLDEWLPAVDDVALLGDGRILWSGTAVSCSASPDVFARCGLVRPFSMSLQAEILDGDAEPTDPVRATAAAIPRRPATTSKEPPVLSVLDARVKIVGSLALTLCVFLCSRPETIAIWLLATVAVLCSAGLGPRRALGALRPVGIVLAFALLANLVSCDGGGAVPVAGPVGIDPAGGARGLVAVLRIVVLVGCSLAVASSTEPTEMSDAVVRLLRPLARLGLPIAGLGTVLSIALRFIPLVGSELQRIRTAQRARGASFDRGPLLRRIRMWATVLTPLIVGLFRRADRLAAAMSARCYAGAGAVQVPRRALPASDRAVLAGIGLMCAVTVALALKGLI